MSAECAACGRCFGGVTGFTEHQRRHGDTWFGGWLECRDPETLGMVISDRRRHPSGKPVWVKQTIHENPPATAKPGGAEARPATDDLRLGMVSAQTHSRGEDAA